MRRRTVEAVNDIAMKWKLYELRPAVNSFRYVLTLLKNQYENTTAPASEAVFTLFVVEIKSQ